MLKLKNADSREQDVASSPARAKAIAMLMLLHCGCILKTCIG